MKKTIATALVAGALVLGTSGSTLAHDKPAHCKQLSVSSVQQSRDVSGQTAAPTVYGPVHNGVRTMTRYVYEGEQTRTVTTTISKCRGKRTESDSVTAWSGARIVKVTSTQHV